MNLKLNKNIYIYMKGVMSLFGWILHGVGSKEVGKKRDGCDLV